MSVLAVVFGAAMIVAGVLAYRGVWRRWAFARPVWSYAIGFGTLYIGLAALVFAATDLWGSRLPLAVQQTAAIVAGVLIVVGLVSLFWFPRVLTPRWFREVRARQKEVRR